MRSAVRTPPGSRSSVASMPRSLSASTSPAARVDFPAPSMPSMVISVPRVMTVPGRRYRSRLALGSVLVLAELERHPHARAVLAPALGSPPRPSHAYLFHGPGGAGKRAAARALAAELLAEGEADPDSARARVQTGAHPDLTRVVPSGAHEILVSDIDGPVISAASRTPFESSRRVFVIERVDELGDEAANRLLKTLEEPASFVHLILLTDRPEEVMPTIRSRCQLVRFEPLSDAAVIEGLMRSGANSDTALACVRLALQDADRAHELSSPEGQ